MTAAESQDRQILNKIISMTSLLNRLVQGMLKLVGVDIEGKGRVFAIGKQVGFRKQSFGRPKGR